MDDREIVEMFWNRDQRAIEATRDKYGPYCGRIAMNILRDTGEAEETVNDTWLSAWNSIPPHRPDMLSAFLGKLTRSAALNRLRNKNRLKRGGGEVTIALEELSECVPSSVSVEQEADRRELGRAIDKYLANLPEAEQKVFVCRYWYLDPISEISLRFEFSESKVKSMLHRTRGKLKRYLEKEGLL